MSPLQAVNELPPGFLGQFEGGEDGLDYFLAKQVLSNWPNDEMAHLVVGTLRLALLAPLGRWSTRPCSCRGNRRS